MITLRCTKKLQQHLGVKPEAEERESTSALGDWFGNLVYMPAGRPLVLVTNERSLLSVVIPCDVDVVAEFKRGAVALLRRLEIPAEHIERETFHLQHIRIGKTNNRRVLGSMNDAVVQLEARLFGEPPQSLEEIEDALAENLYTMLKYTPPVDVARELLGAPPRPKVVKLPVARPKSRVASTAEPDFSTTTAVLSMLLAGHRPQNPRKKIAEDERVPVKLSPRDRELIIEHAMLDAELTEPLEKAPPEAISVGYTLFDIDEILGYIAAGANHCKSKKLQRELDGLWERLKLVMESYDDGSWQSSGL